MTKVNITVLECHIYRIIFPCKKLERTFKLNITLLCKTKTKTWQLFLSLSKFFLPHNQHLDFICLEYDDTVNLQSIRDLKNHCRGSLPAGIHQRKFDRGDSRWWGTTLQTYMWKYWVDQHLMVQNVNSISNYKILVLVP